MLGETLGSYRIVSEVGKGGMGVVYLAEHTKIGRKVAVKLLRSDMPEEYVERFFTEAKAAAQLHHPGLVDVFDFGHHTDGSAFIVMEYLAGESLAERLAREPRLPVDVACAITRSVAQALQIAHDQGIIHRDLKPGNIFLIPDADSLAGVRTKVLDFGIAKLMRDRDQRSVRTASGAVIGTPRYMSPEQCKNASNVDGRSDIYSLGCILYEMLLGVAPFDYDSWAELVGAHIYEVPPKPREIDDKLPADVETLVCKMTEKAPDDRFRSMSDLAQSLEVILHEHGPAPGRKTPTMGARPITKPPFGAKHPSNAERDQTLPASSLPNLEQVLKPTTENKRKSDPALDATVSQSLKAQPAAPPDTLTPPPPTVAAARKPPYLAIGLAVVGLAALGVAIFVVTREDSAKEPEDTYIVVDERDKPDQGSQQQPAALADAGTTIADHVETTVDAGTKTTKPPSNETDVAALERMFKAQKPAITNCLAQHPSPTVKASVRFQIDKAGAVTLAEVLPPDVGSTPLGTCIAGVARKIQFGPQPKPAAFRMPLELGR